LKPKRQAAPSGAGNNSIPVCADPKPPASEDRVLELLKRRFGRRSAGLVLGMGDDAAVIRTRAGEDWVITTDMLLEGVDFREGWLTPAQLGHKALAVNLSDLAAMGARPRFYLVALGVPPSTAESWIVSFYRGMSALGERHRAVLLGGDLSRSAGGAQVTVTAIGVARRGRLLRRSGGKPGDWLYVTGVLGRSAAGLRLLLSRRLRGSTPREREALRTHKMPLPRCAAGQWLAASGLVRAMMDLSDGLSADLPRLCRASGTGAELHADRIPLFEAARHWGASPLDLALNGGEDFELLFAVPERAVEELRRTYPRRFPPIAAIGRLTRGSDIMVRSHAGARPRKLSAGGFDHFRTGINPP